MSLNSDRLREFFRFLISGTLTFGFVYIIYYVFLLFGTGYIVAYSISYVSGILFAWLANSLYSFAVRPRLARLLPYAAFAMGNYLIGLQLFRWLMESQGVAEELAPVLVIAALVPLSFVGTRLTLLTRIGRHKPERDA